VPKQRHHRIDDREPIDELRVDLPQEGATPTDPDTSIVIEVTESVQMTSCQAKRIARISKE
jgi:hypothetical protein